MVSCVACGCSSTVTHKKEGTTFHKFPKDSKKKELWMEFLKNQNCEPKSNSVLCSRHFKKDCFDLTSRLKVRLKPEAVPTIKVSRLKYVRHFNSVILEDVDSKTVDDPDPRDPDIKTEIDVSDVKIEIDETNEQPEIEILTIIGPSPPCRSPVPEVSSTNENIPAQDTLQEKILKKKLTDLQSSNMLKGIKIRELQKVTWRQKKQIASLKCEVEELKQKNVLLEQENIMLEHYNHNNKDNGETLTIEIV